MITPEEVKHLAKLSRIAISEDEVTKITAEIDSILNYVGQITSVVGDVSGSVPVLRNVMREDVITHAEGEYTEEILLNAPAREGQYLQVKKIL